MARLKVLTFDVTNTILKVIGSPSFQYAQVANNIGINISSDQLERVYGHTWKETREKFPHYGINDGMTSREWWEGFVHKVFINAGYSGDIDNLKKVSDGLWTAFSEGSNWEVLPQSHETLGELKNKGVKLGVISNFDERLHGTLEKHNLKDYFDFCVTPLIAKTSKPDPAMFEFALAYGDFEAHHAGHIGDHVNHDYWAPKEIGFTPFLIDRQSKLTDDKLQGINRKYVLHDLKGLLEFF